MLWKQQQGAFSEKDEQLREVIAKLDTLDADMGPLSFEEVTFIRRQLAEGQILVRESVDRLRQSQEENEMIMRRREEVEQRLGALEAEYEELLGASAYKNYLFLSHCLFKEKTIHDEETTDVDIAQSMSDLKVSFSTRHFSDQN